MNQNLGLQVKASYKRMDGEGYKGAEKEKNCRHRKFS